MTRRINSTTGSIVFLILVAALWVDSLSTLQLSAIGSYGLVSALPVTMYAALALLTLSMVMAIHRGERNSVLAAHVVLFILMVHGTPALLYGVLRYSWAWKHLGLIDYLNFHRAVHPGRAGDLAVYQNWPGFFTFVTSWFVGSGLTSWSGMAQWAPPVFELLFAGGVLGLLRAIETDRRLVWLGVWFFAIGNWVGQDYFSPQAFAYFLYLAVLMIVFRWLVKHPAMPRRLTWLVRDNVQVLVKPRTRTEVEAQAAGSSDPTPVPSRAESHMAIFAVVLITAAIATSHPLTPVVLLAVLTALTIMRVMRYRTLPIMVAVPTLLWYVSGARTYTSANEKTLISKFGSVDNAVQQGLSKAAHAVESQHIVSLLGRFEVAFLLLLAAYGVLRRVRSGHWDIAAMVMAGVPVFILAGNSYGGEALFRVYLFSLPFLAYFAAAACYPQQGVVKARSAVFALLCSAVLISTFLFAYYGKDQWTFFTPSEERAAKLIFDNAQPGSLLVDGTADYPTHFKNYSDFTYVDIASEPFVSYEQVVKDPVGTLYNWLADTKYTQAFLIITKSQKAESGALGELPPHTLERIEQYLLASPKFKVLYHDSDAVVFTVPHAPVG